jgi:arsenical resistance protein ArsH
MACSLVAALPATEEGQVVVLLRQRLRRARGGDRNDDNDVFGRNRRCGVSTCAPDRIAMHDLPNVSLAHFESPDLERLEGSRASSHAPRILLLYGSLRERSYSRLLTLEAERILQKLGAETRVFDPRDLPLPDSVLATHPKVAELRESSLWSEGQVWCSPERHGALTGVMKSLIDWIPLEIGSVRPTQGRTLAVMQVSGGSQSFNAVNSLRLLGRWMRMFTIPNQSSVAKAFQEFDEAGRMRPSAYYDRLVDVMEELVKFTLLLRDRSDYLTSRYSERKEAAAKSEAAKLAANAMQHEPRK